ncbi:MAG: hypothetical protein ACKVOM_11280 [Ferruginibacter sp.]
MPAVGNNKAIIEFEKKYFLALSYVIFELGNLKDDGLKVMAIAEAIAATQFVDDETALQRAYPLSKISSEGVKEIMARAKDVAALFFEEDNLGKMMVGIKSE